MRQHIYKHLNELIEGLFPTYVIPAHGFHVLDIGWGMGESVHELALKYPSAHITGIDMDISTVKQAQSLIHGLDNATIFVQDFQHLDETILTPASFGIIHLHFLAGEITLQQFSPFLQSLVRHCQPGGLFVWTEAELPITTSLACQHLCWLVLQGLRARGHAYSQGNSLGLTARTSRMLSNVGCKDIHTKAYAIDISAKTKGNDVFIAQLSSLRQQICAFLLEMGITTVTRLEDLYLEMLQEIQEDQFCGLLYVRTVVAKRL